ncbi:unnamed protein product [Pieris brassicae]|uniref:Uncharacterized protein n=1 Tax=Pieris brassicae TaxID=7116 RepID=A0A9P0XDQ8_PIEBR|nr:unnamed protein product [Pieris brassicae]
MHLCGPVAPLSYARLLYVFVASVSTSYFAITTLPFRVTCLTVNIANVIGSTLHECESDKIDVCCMCVTMVMDVVLHLDGKTFRINMMELDSGGFHHHVALEQMLYRPNEGTHWQV